MYVVATPLLLVGDVEEHALIPLGPLKLHVMLPIGAAEPIVPVTTAVNVSVELSEVPPAAVSTTEGDVCAIVTTVDEAGAKLV